jgi:hypothetical protein
MYRFVDAMMIRAATRRCADWMPSLPDLADTSEDQWRSWLREVWQTPGITDAVEVASPILALRIERICAGWPVEERDVRSAVRSVIRYLVRATGRATPFGLFAGVASARFGHPGPDLLAAEHRPAARIENDWLAGVITQLESCRALRRISWSYGTISYSSGTAGWSWPATSPTPASRAKCRSATPP